MRRASWMMGLALLAMAGAAAAENATYTYDAIGRVASATFVDGGVTYNITYSYDAAGNRCLLDAARSGCRLLRADARRSAHRRGHSRRR